MVLLIIILFSAWMFLFGVILTRNHFVFAYRMRIIRSGKIEELRRLPSYNRMVFQLFTYDWQEYLNGNNVKN